MREDEIILQAELHNHSLSSYPEIALVGNPNVGKSLIFNQLTGANQKVANFPGITLQYLKGNTQIDEQSYTIVDLPGIYGFATNKIEERVTHEYLLTHNPQLIINVVDARKLERNLSLTLQLLETEIPVVLVLTFVDKLKSKISIPQLQEQLGVPVIAVNSHKKEDVTNIYPYFPQTSHQVGKKIQLGDHQQLINRLEAEISPPIMLHGENPFNRIPKRWIIIHSLLLGPYQLHTLPAWITKHLQAEINLERQEFHQLQLELIQQYYAKAKTIAEVVYLEDQDNFQLLSRMDSILLHPYLGLGIFAVIMYIVFTATFQLSEPINMLLEEALGWMADTITSMLGSSLIQSFLVDGIINGVGFVMVFIPQIAILFTFIAILEHTGYLARVVFITDRYLSRINISGTSVAPLLLGFGCNVPGIMATKSIQDQNERIAVGLANPFMSCSARLPVYVIITSAIFPSYQGLVVTGLYFLGIALAVVTMYALRKTILKGQASLLLMELPELQMPNTKAVGYQVYRHTKKFVQNAASWMTMGIIAIWLLSITGPSGYLGPEGMTNSAVMEQSWIFWLGKILAPLFMPMGWDVRLIVALVLGFIAKEIVIGSLGVIYGTGSSSAAISAVISSAFDPVSALAFLVFVLVYTPCIGTYFTLRQEFGRKWANFSIVLGLVLGYFLALMITIIGNLLLP